MYFFHSSGSRCWQTGFLPGPLSLTCKCLPSRSVLKGLFLCKSIPNVFLSSYTETSPIGLGLTHMILSNLNYLFKKLIEIVVALGVKTSVHKFVEGGIIISQHQCISRMGYSLTNCSVFCHICGCLSFFWVFVYCLYYLVWYYFKATMLHSLFISFSKI